jgi:hypothetical protein
MSPASRNHHCRSPLGSHSLSAIMFLPMSPVSRQAAC